MNITSAEYRKDIEGVNECVMAEIDGKILFVPLDEGNRHYQAILEWVADGNTIDLVNLCTRLDVDPTVLATDGVIVNA